MGIREVAEGNLPEASQDDEATHILGELSG